MKKRFKELLEEYFAGHPHVKPAKKKARELTEQERTLRNNHRRKLSDKARNRYTY